MTRSLPTVARVLVRQAQRLDDLLGLAQVAIGAVDDVLGQQPRADELLGDGRCAALARARRVLGDGRDQRGRVDAGVLPERAVLRRRRGVEDQRRDIGVVDDAAALVLEPAQLHLAVAVVDDRGLGEGQVAELARVGQVGREDAKRRDRQDAGQPDHDQGGRGDGTEHHPESPRRAGRDGLPTPDALRPPDRDDARGPGHEGSPGRLGRPTTVSMGGCCGPRG